MEKWIYKITNKINGKIYIGQSKNPKQRFNQHIKEKRNSSIHNAIKKYGKNNFIFEIIEGPIENYNEREIYWIKYYNSYKLGYNNTLGGDEPPIIFGEDSTLAKFSNETILNLQLDLINTNMTYSELSKKYNIQKGYIVKINKGETRKNPQFKYPLRKSNNIKKTEEEIDNIILQLLNTCKSVERIAKENNMDSLTVYKINLGKQQNCPKNYEYPIRLSGERISRVMFNNIIKDLLEEQLKLKDIENKYNLSKATINRINQGKSYKRDYLNYPIRPSNKRVYK